MTSGGPSGPPQGQIVYVGPSDGSLDAAFSFVVPAEVTSITVVCVSPGSKGNGAGGSLAYGNNITVTPGETLTVRTGGSNRYENTGIGSSRILRGGTTLVQAGVPSNRSNSGSNLSGGGLGGSPGGSWGGAGAAGYTGNGGDGNPNYGNAYSGAGGGGGGGGGGRYGGASQSDELNNDNTIIYYFANGAGGGGGVGLLGQGANGAGGAPGAGGGGSPGGTGGGGGSGGTSGTSGSGGSPNSAGNAGSGGDYGAGGGAGGYHESYYLISGEPIVSYGAPDGNSGRGAVRIIWPGNTRQFPSTNTGDV